MGVANGSVVASVNATLVPPRADRPYEGLLQITTDITPMAGMEYDAGGVAGVNESREREALFDRMIDRAVRHTDAIDREALCVIAGKKVWCVTLTLHLVSDEGAAYDAAVLASLVALRHFRRPDVSIIEGEVVVHSPDERVPVPLACHHAPLCATYAVFQLQPKNEEERSLLEAQSRTAPGKTDEMEVDEAKPAAPLDVPVALLDPSLLEQTLAPTSITFVINAQREVCVLDKAGGTPLPYQFILALLNDAAKRATQLGAIMESALAHDAQKRIVSVQ